MQAALNYVLDAYRAATAPAPGKLIAFLATAVGLFLLILVSYLVVRSREIRRRQTLVDGLYQRRVAEAGLTLEDKQLLDILVARLDRPMELKHRLLADRGLFSKTAARAVSDGAATKEAIAALRMRLGLAHGDVSGLIRSSGEIGDGQEVRLSPEGGPTLPARVIAGTPQALVLEADSTGGLPAIGSRVGVAFTTEAGNFRFTTEVLERSERTLSLAHSERVEHEQARRFYRKGMDTPAEAVDIATGTAFRGRLLDLSGGGASLEIPEGGPRLKKGEELELRLELPGAKPISVPARIVRFSRRGGCAHLEFHGLSGRTQDRIVGYVLG